MACYYKFRSTGVIDSIISWWFFSISVTNITWSCTKTLCCPYESKFFITFANIIIPIYKENTSYSAMLNIREPVPHPESITINSSDPGITSTSYPPEFLPFPSNSGIPIYMDDRPAILLKHVSNSGTEFPGIPGNSYRFPPIPLLSNSGITLRRNQFLQFRNS